MDTISLHGPKQALDVIPPHHRADKNVPTSLSAVLSWQPHPAITCPLNLASIRRPSGGQPTYAQRRCSLSADLPGGLGLFNVERPSVYRLWSTICLREPLPSDGVSMAAPSTPLPPTDLHLHYGLANLASLVQATHSTSAWNPTAPGLAAAMPQLLLPCGSATVETAFALVNELGDVT